MSSSSIRKPHAVVFPIPLQGHINPMMLLAQHLNSSGIRVTFLLPERTLSTLHSVNNNHTTDNSNRTAHLAFDKGPQYQLHCVHDGYNIACHAEADMLNNITHGQNGALKIDDGIRNAKSKPKNSSGNDDNHKEAEPITNASNNCHTSLLSNKRNDHPDDGDGDGNGDGDGDEGDNDAYVHHASDDDFVPPIQFELLPDASSSDDQTLPMSSYVLVFLNSMPLLMRKLEELLERMQQKGQPVTCIISDSFVPWTQDVASKFGIPRMEFWSSSVTVYSMGYHIPQLIDKGYLPAHPGDGQESCIDIIPGLAPFRLADFFYDMHPHAISSPVFDFICKAFSRAKEAQRVLVNSFYHLEKDITEALRAEGVLIYPIGPLLPSHMCTSRDRPHLRSIKEMESWSTSLYADDDDCLAWLDTQAQSSVIYVSFGSLVSISKDEIEELMLGLEGSKQPYLLVIRPDMGSGVCAQNTRTGRGRICEWVPQIHVLGHPAIGAFLTHCGWNSIMEGMYMGVPMIACPRESEQHTNMRSLRDEWKVAIELNDQQGGVGAQSRQRQGSTNRVQIKKELVEGAIKALMQEEKGKVVRERMKGLQKAARRAAAHELGSSLHMLIRDIKRDMSATPHSSNTHV